MRLRLTVLRHGLPRTEVLWDIPEDQTSQLTTVAQLLEQVNEVLPLESPDWGLEDYIVQVGVFECLHFAQLRQILKDEDQVTIRPIQTTEVRSRTLSGRHQISANGQHLIDGVPFGRPYLRRADRPPIQIPPRKRCRLTSESEDEEIPGELEWLSRSTGGAEDDPAEQLRITHDDGTDGHRHKRRKTVRFTAKEVNSQAQTTLDEDDEDEEDSDFNPDAVEASSDEEQDNESSSDSSGSDSESSDESSVVSSSDSSSEEESGKAATPKKRSSDKVGNHEKTSAQSKSQRPKESNRPKDGAKETANTHDTLEATIPPYAGTAATHARNKRRRITKKLVYLKKAGKLPENATIQDMELYMESQCPDGPDAEPRNDGSAINVDARNAIELSAGSLFTLKRQQLLDAIESGGINIDSREQSTKETVTAVPHMDSHEAGINATTPPSSEPPRKRAKLDIAGSRRMLFGSLGLRTPKTPKDETRIKDRLMALSKPRPARQAPSLQAQPTQAEAIEARDDQSLSEDDDWEAKIDLKAVECCDRTVELSKPSFPFVQRWNVQQQDNWRRNKRGHQADKAWNDVPERLQSRSNSNSDSGSDAHRERSPAASIRSSSEDLPPLPRDLSALKELTANNAKRGACIAYKKLELSQANNWNPTISPYRTAKVIEDRGDGTMEVKLAKRYRRRKNVRYDNKGRRLYDRFEMPGFDDTVDQDGRLIDINLHDMIEPILLREAPATTSLEAASAKPADTDEPLDYGDDQSVPVKTAVQGIVALGPSLLPDNLSMVRSEATMSSATVSASA